MDCSHSTWKNKASQQLIRSDSGLFSSITGFLRRCVFRVLSRGPMPRHIAFILDGNRRYGRKLGLPEGEGHHIGCLNLSSILRYCCEMGVGYVTVYAFSIDNFKRASYEVQFILDLIYSKIQALLRDVNMVNELGVRVDFVGKLNLLNDSMQTAATAVKEATAGNSRLVLLVCLAYTSTDEIVHGVQGACEEWARVSSKDAENWDNISVGDVERRMYLGGIPEPDILIRTAGETRLSNFVLWQTGFSLLYSPRCLWPEISARHMVWAVLLFQRNHTYLKKVQKKCGIPASVEL